MGPVASVAIGFLPTEFVDLSAAVDVLIIGSGPAGLTAAIYVGRNARSVLVIGGPRPGGAGVGRGRRASKSRRAGPPPTPPPTSSAGSAS